MSGAGGQREWLDALGESLCGDSEIEFVVAFGSQFDSPQPSDLDIAVKFADSLSARERFRKRCSLSGTLQREERPFVDISDIETLPLDVAHDAVTGKFLCGDDQRFRQFRGQIEAEFESRRDDIRRQQQGVIDRIAEEGLRG
jgi:predicted nucleotidyltransferase